MPRLSNLSVAVLIFPSSRQPRFLSHVWFMRLWIRWGYNSWCPEFLILLLGLFQTGSDTTVPGHWYHKKYRTDGPGMDDCTTDTYWGFPCAENLAVRECNLPGSSSPVRLAPTVNSVQFTPSACNSPYYVPHLAHALFSHSFRPSVMHKSSRNIQRPLSLADTRRPSCSSSLIR